MRKQIETASMLDKTKILPIIINAVKAGEENGFAETLHDLGSDKVTKASEIAEDIKSICEEYDYFQSKDFQARIEGKSEAYVNFVKQSFSQAHEDRLLEAIRNIEQNDTIFDLIQDHQHQYVSSIRKKLAQLYS